jgi:Ca2+-binding EF-hand superfamily protein
MALSEFQETKHVRWFELMDKNRDGALNREDWDLLGKNFCAITGVSSLSDGYSTILDIFSAQWRAICQLQNVADDGEIELLDFLQFSDQVLVSSNEEEYDLRMLPYLRSVFESFDQNSDGLWSLSEWGQAYAVWGLQPYRADLAFQHLDKNADGYTEFDEFYQAVKDYQRSDNRDDSGNWLFGDSYVMGRS